MMKNIFVILSVTLFILLAACTAETQQGNIVFNFCDIDTTYIDCPQVSFSIDEITMRLDVLSSDGLSVDSILYELPDEGIYCTADAASGLVQEDSNSYLVETACDLSSYEGQNTQLTITVTLTLTDGTTITETGSVEDWVEE
jgi:hypothetical protein